MINLGKELIPWLGKTAKMLDYYQNKELQEKGFDVTKEQYIVLKILFYNNGTPQHKLACLTERDKTSMTRLVNTMEKKNLIARLPSQEDKRINLIFITKGGEKVLNELYPHMVENVNKLQEGITRQEIEFVIDILKKIQVNIDKNEGCNCN